jgi:ElaB/YqjD/DUF883 family membrane-anchored ribosome-binding protein
MEREERRNLMSPHEANQRLTTDLKLVIRDAEDLLKATAGEAGEKVKEIRGRLSTALDSARATCQRLHDKTVEAAKATDHVIREHPYESIGVALGVGLLIGVLVGRR